MGCLDFCHYSSIGFQIMSEPVKQTNHGGARPGAGRKPGVTKQQHETLFDAAWPYERRMAAVQRLATIAETSVNEDVVLKAIEMLLNRVFGKPTERREVTGADGGPIELNPVDYRAGLDALKPDADT
jgi:hypothetical protein